MAWVRIAVRVALALAFLRWAGPEIVAADEGWEAVSTTDAPAARRHHTAVWTGAELIVWGGDVVDGVTSTGGRYDPVLDAWTATDTGNAPEGRRHHTAVWTGREMIVWGGEDEAGDVHDTGAAYDPAFDAWLPIASSAGQVHHSVVWTGKEMIVWGGLLDGTDAVASGRRYDPETDAWSPVPSPPGAIGENERHDHTAVWTGREMIVWGGWDPDGLRAGNGWRFDPDTDDWTPLNDTDAPTPRAGHSAVWTGRELIVWGGDDGLDPESGLTGTGGRYDPSTDTWTEMTIEGAPNGRWRHSAVWTGRDMVVFGGEEDSEGQIVLSDSGGRYDPTLDRWFAVPADVFQGRRDHTAVWTGREKIVWGGTTFIGRVNSGRRYTPPPWPEDTWRPLQGPGSENYGTTAVWTGREMIGFGARGEPVRYDPVLDSVAAGSTFGAPSGRRNHSAVWTGREMIVWGGSDGALRDDGARYDPVLDAWTEVESSGAPARRQWHRAVWTGREMIVWGGSGASAILGDGARYDPETDQWAPVASAGAPAARTAHAAVWTGREMIVWGGSAEGGGSPDDGGRYDPDQDDWTALPQTGQPVPRTDLSAVWTGREMIVWGGLGPDGFESTGGRFDPAASEWTATSDTGVPDARRWHSAVWTGREMIVWGGSDGGGTVTGGGRYDPITDAWIATTTFLEPSRRSQHAAVWTGREMIVYGGQGPPNPSDFGSYGLPPIIEATPSSLEFEAIPGGPATPSSIDVAIGNRGGGGFAFAATFPSWTSVSPESGGATAEYADLVSVAIVHDGLAVDVYEGELVINAEDAANSPLRVPITLTVAFGPPETMEGVSGAEQDAIAGAPLEDLLVVRVRDAYENPLPGVAVAWDGYGGATFDPAETDDVTDEDGLARARGIAPTGAGETIRFEATIDGGLGVAFDFVVQSAEPAEVVSSSGDGQRAPAGEALPADLVVRVADAFDNPVPDVDVAWSVTAGGGSVDPLSTTDGDGLARVRPTVGTAAGEDVNVYRASVSGLDQTVDFTASTDAGPADALVYVSGDGQTGVVGEALDDPLVVRVLDAYGNRVPDHGVGWDVPEGAPFLAVVQTDGEGEASVAASLGTVSGAQVFSAYSAEGAPVDPVIFEATAQPGPPEGVIDLIAEPTSLVADGTSTTLVEGGPVPDSYLNPVAEGTLVTVSTTLGTITTGDADPGEPGLQVATDADGRIAFTLQAGTDAGTATVMAMTVVGEAAGQIAVAFQPGDIASIAIVSGDAQTATAGGPLPDPLVVRVADGNDNPVAGATVEWSTPDGGSFFDASGPTDASGHTQVGAELGTVAGPQSFTATVAGTSLSATFAATATAGSPATVAFVGGEDQTGVAGAPLDSPVTVRVTDLHDNRVPGATIAFSSPDGAGFDPEEAITDGAGEASSAVTLGTVAGVQAIHAAWGSLSADPIGATALPGAAAALEIVSGDAQVAPVEATLSDPLVVRVLDAFDNPVPDIAVIWTVTGGGGSVAPDAASTDADGHVSAEATLGAVAGEAVHRFEASAAGAEPVVFVATGTPLSADRLVAVSGDGQSGIVDLELPEPLVARVEDVHGNGVPGVSVAWSAVAGSGRVLSATATSDADGHVSTGVVLGEVAGVENNRFEARISGLSPLVFAATALPGAAAGLVAVAGDGQIGTSGAALAAPLAVAVQDALGNPVPGHPVTWSVPEGGGAIEPVSAVTGADGTATAAATLGDGGGRHVFEASAVDDEDVPLSGSPVTFTATAAHLSAELEADGGPHLAGATVRIHARLTSLSDEPLSDVALSLSLEGLELLDVVGATARGDRWQVETIAAGETVTVTVSARLVAVPEARLSAEVRYEHDGTAFDLPAGEVVLEVTRRHHYDYAGCGCAATGGRGTAAPALALLAGLLVLRRRGRTRPARELDAPRSAALALALALALISPRPAAAATGPAEPTPDAPRRSLAWLGLTPQGDFPPALASTLSDVVHTEVDALEVYQVIGMSDVQTLLGLEAQRQLMGCEDDSVCLAEIAGALGADRALAGTVARIEDTVVLNFSLLDVSGSRLVGRAGRRIHVAGDGIDPVMEALGELMSELAALDGLVADPRRRRGAQRAFDVRVGLRADANLQARPMLPVPGASLALRRGPIDAAASLVWVPSSTLAPVGPLRPLTLRVEGRYRHALGGPLTPHAGAGVVLPFPDVGFRAAAGASLPIARLELTVELAYERYLVQRDPDLVVPGALLVAAGVSLGL